MMDPTKVFYDREYEDERYARPKKQEEHPFYPTLLHFVEKYGLRSKRCLEVGCGRGAFQDIVDDYVGVDISSTVGRYLHKPFVTSSATNLPFTEDSFDAIWSYAVLEHVPEPEQALNEMRRVLKPDGMLLLAPAWQCRPWAAEGYPIRPYSDFNLRGKFIKASIPIRNSVAFRLFYIIPRRIMHLIHYLLVKHPIPFRYQLLRPNYNKYWMSDSDALNSMDPFDAILWFISRNDESISYPSLFSAIKIRTGALLLRLIKLHKGRNTQYR